MVQLNKNSHVWLFLQSLKNLLNNLPCLIILFYNLIFKNNTMNFEKLAVKAIKIETKDTKTIYFDIPENLKTRFIYKPGQYLTLKAIINGNEVRRAYSISTSPIDNSIGVTVKKINGGKMSSIIHDQWSIGDIIDVAAPEGNFIVEADHDKKRNHYFIAAGSGITPIMSMMKTILEEEPMSMCYLLYGSRDENSIIFKDALDKLETKYSGQIFITHTLSKPLEEKESGVFGMFKKSKINWLGEVGRIDVNKIKDFLSINISKISSENHFYLCGPGDIILASEKELEARGIGKKHINREFFSTPVVEGSHVISGPSNIKVHLNGEVVTFASEGKKPILDELIALKKNPPYSCTSGACSSCMAKVISGKVEMEVCYALDESEIEKGFILTCQAKAVSPELEITFVV